MPDDDYDVTDDPGLEGNPLVRAQLRRQAREGAKARKEADALRRELAYVRAGVDEDNPLGKMFRSSYDGPDDPEAMAAAWAEVAPAPAPVIDPESIVAPETVHDPGERASTMERQALASGGASHERGSWTPDPRDVSSAAAKKVIAEGGTEEASLAASFDVLARAAQAGDRRVRLN